MSMRSTILWATLVHGAVSLAPLPAFAQSEPRASAPPTVNATRVTQPPSINGRLDDEVWRTATHIDTFIQQTPSEGAPATEKTDVYLAYDSEKLYVAIHAHYSSPGLIRANRVDRDKTENDDTVIVSFDPFLDQQTGYFFSVNGYGVQGDSVLKGGQAGGTSSASGAPISGLQGDASWNALFTSAGQLVEDGWTAEIAIPFKSLRYPARGPGELHRWGFQIQRDVKTKFETAVWAPMSRDVAGYLRQMGTLTGISNLSTSRNLEVLPSFTAVQAGSLNRTTGVYSTDDVQEGGVNVKYGLTSTLTVDFTYNPDFSQIESDRQQIEVNQRFPVQYAELRPFFLEGQEIFRVFAPAQMVHTRTIVDPQYGAKVSGKVGKATVALILANDEAPGRVDDTSAEAFGKTAQVVIARARYDLRPESSIGTLFTERAFLGGHNRLFGMDATFRVGRNAQIVASADISDTRRLDGTRKVGHYFDLNTRKDGRNLSYFVAHHHFNPQFQADLGFIRRVDYKETVGNVAYRWWPEGWIVNWGPQFNYDRTYDYQGTLQNAGPGAQLNVQFARNITASATIDRDLERYRTVDFRKTRFSLSTSVNASRRLSFSAKINRGDEIRFTANPFLGRTTVYTLSATLRPNSRFQSVLNLDTNRFTDPGTAATVFDIKILRAQSTYQFSPRLLIRNITEINTFNKTLFLNLLATYRVNAGTAFYVGYDDRYMQGDAVNPGVFPDSSYQRTNRAVFTKLQYLFRRNSN